MELNQKLLHELLQYDPWTGVLTWRRRAPKWFKREHDCKVWNAKYAGKPAGSISVTNGRCTIQLFGRRHNAHRIIWLWMTGAFPVNEIDHKNRRPADNRFANMREATRTENGRNASLSSNNTSGFTGVSFEKRSGRWLASIKLDQKMYRLGTFKTQAEAVRARSAANRKHGFAPGHGRLRLVK